jgi:hypothetical protein
MPAYKPSIRIPRGIPQLHYSLSYTFPMAHSKTKFKSHDDKASPYFKAL